MGFLSPKCLAPGEDPARGTSAFTGGVAAGDTFGSLAAAAGTGTNGAAGAAAGAKAAKPRTPTRTKRVQAKTWQRQKFTEKAFVYRHGHLQIGL